jgi:hypothetical protein
MDRATVFYGQIPLETDLLRAEQFAMTALAKLSEAVLGVSTVVVGFPLTPTSPASLVLNLGAGQVYQQENLEQSAWSSLPVDTHTVVKQGLQLDATSLTFAPPSTTGFAQCFLVEVAYEDLDGGQTVRPYFNANNPAQPFQGPGNNGQADNTVRKGAVAVQVKAGIAATSGTEVAPTPDAGYAGLWVVTLTAGQSSISAGNIAQYSEAPYILATLPEIPNAVQSAEWIYAGQSAGTTAAFTAALSPAPVTLTQGMKIIVTMAAAPAASATLNLNQLGAAAIKRRGGSLLSGGEWASGDNIGFTWNNGAWQLDGLSTTDVTGLTAGTAPEAGEGIGVSGQSVSLNFPALTEEDTINSNDLVSFYAVEAEGGQAAGHHYKTTFGKFAAAVTNLTAATGRLLAVRTFANPGSTIYTPTAGTNKVRVTVVGGGGAGTGCDNLDSSHFQAAPGGGGGGFATSWITSGFSGVTITVGAGGAGQNNGTNNGNGGGQSEFGSFLSASGGQGGTFISPVTGAFVQGGGSGGQGSGGNVANGMGQQGGNAFGTSNDNMLSGYGGGSYLGFGPSGFAGGTSQGNNGVSPGSGGSGAINQIGNAAKFGGSGANGIVIVEEFS